MTDLERAVARFKAFWIEAYPETVCPETTKDIQAWYDANHKTYRGVRYVPGTGWVQQNGDLLTDELGLQQHRVNVVINEASLIGILARDPDTVEGYW